MRVRAEAKHGDMAFCLVNEAENELLSDHYPINPAAGEITLFIAYDPAKGPARLCLRNLKEMGVEGAIEISGIDQKVYAAAD